MVSYEYRKSGGVVSHNTGPSGFQETMSQYLPSKTLLGVLALSVVTSKVAYDLLSWWNLDQINKIDCAVGTSSNEQSSNFERYQLGATNGSPQGQYCLAKMYKEGIGTKLSKYDAINWFKKAGDQGLFLAIKELCRPSLFSGVNLTELGNKKVEGLAAYCCPPATPSICPWDSISQHFLAKDHIDTSSGTLPYFTY